MKQQDYVERWNELCDEKNKLIDERTNLETSLSEIKTQIEHLDEVLNHLAPLAGISISENFAALGITDAIRLTLKKSKTRMTPQDVRRALVENGFDLSGYTAPMASIYKILSRLADDSDSQVSRQRDESGVFYSWDEVDDFAQSAEISDDDIPF
ncbi:MAG: hypothetical protein ACLQMG_16915 [Terracidiphilus sp.]